MASELSESDLALLRQYATENDEGDWYFGSVRNPHKAESALAVIRACRLLDAEVTDILPAKTWYKLVFKVADLETRLKRLEHGDDN